VVRSRDLPQSVVHGGEFFAVLRVSELDDEQWRGALREVGPSPGRFSRRRCRDEAGSSREVRTQTDQESTVDEHVGLDSRNTLGCRSDEDNDEPDRDTHPPAKDIGDEGG